MMMNQVRHAAVGVIRPRYHGIRCTVSGRHCRRTVCFSSDSRASSSSSQPPLLLWLGNNNQDATTASAPIRLLLPADAPSPSQSTISNSQNVLDVVNEHYDKEHFVGGMGEGDPGVYFASSHTGDDTLAFAELIQASIALVKQTRHGVPFGMFTSGLLPVTDVAVPLTELGVDTLQVSLFAASPLDYATASGQDRSSFGMVCGFIADAAEQGVAVEVGVLRPHASAARTLATSLGAIQVHVYDQ